MEQGFQEYPIFDASGMKVGIVVSRYNLIYSQQLLKFAKDALFEYNIGSQEADTIFVAGPMEVPYALATLAKKGVYDCLIVIGSIIAETSSRFDLEVATIQQAVARVTLDHHVPVGFGMVVTRKSKDVPTQLYLAAEAAAGAIELANISSQLTPKKSKNSVKKPVKKSKAAKVPKVKHYQKNDDDTTDDDQTET